MRDWHSRSLGSSLARVPMAKVAVLPYGVRVVEAKLELYNLQSVQQKSTRAVPGKRCQDFHSPNSGRVRFRVEFYLHDEGDSFRTRKMVFFQ
jgi:hypothetical protein